MQHEGFVSELVYKQFKETGDPYPCCENTSGPKVEKVLNYVMDRILKNKYPWENEKSFYTAIKWETKYSEIASELLSSIKKYIDDNKIDKAEDYRIVFWFDN
jgi:hypothetical protein